MSDAFIGEIRLVGFAFAPVGWASCDGQSMSIDDNNTLFALIGTTYGGDGVQTFNLPNLNARVPVGQGTRPGGSTFVLGQAAGTESVTLTTTTIPGHTHSLRASTAAGTADAPGGAMFGVAQTVQPYRDIDPTLAMATPISPAGGSQPHENLQPFVVVRYIIALEGIFPSQN